MTPVERAEDVVRAFASVTRHRVDPSYDEPGYDYPDHDEMVRLVADAIRDAVAAERAAIRRTLQVCVAEHSSTAGEKIGLANALACVEARG